MTCRLPNCDQPTDDHAYVCRDCADRFERDVAETPWLVDQLVTALARQGRFGSSNSTGRPVGRERPLPVDLRASLALDRYRKSLRGVADVLGYVHRTGTADWRFVEPIIVARWLLAQTNRVRFHPDAPEPIDEVRRAFGFAIYVVNRPAERWYAGPCWSCDRDLYADVDATVVTCAACGLHFDVSERRTYLLREAEDQLANATTIARAVSWLGAEPLTADRVRKWAERGRLTPKAIDRCSTHRVDVQPPTCRRCQPLYRVGDAIDLLARETNRGTNHDR